MPTLQSMAFDTSDLRLVNPPQEEGDRSGKIIWMSGQGDGISLIFFNKPPNLPSNLRSLPEVGKFYQRQLTGGIKLVSVRMPMIDGCRAIELIIKAPQKPTGMTYVGSVTIPFRDFSFVVKVQAEERGTTGMRESVLFERHMKEGKKAGNGSPFEGFYPDDPQYDAEFPQHPLSWVRGILKRVERSAKLSDEVRSSTPFPLPS